MLFRLFATCTLLPLLVVGSEQRQRHHALDLTLPAPPQLSVRVPGGSTDLAVAALPLQANMKSFRRRGGSSPAVFEATLTLRNTSREKFELPTGRDDSLVLKDGNKARRTFLFLVRQLAVNSKQPSSPTVVVSTAGSSSIPSSILILNPGEEVDVLLAINIGELRFSLHSDESPKLQLGCAEWKYSDHRYFIEAMTERLWAPEAISVSPEPNIRRQ